MISDHSVDKDAPNRDFDDATLVCSMVPPPTIGLTRRPTCEDELQALAGGGDPAELVEVVGVQIDAPRQSLPNFIRGFCRRVVNDAFVGAAGRPRQRHFFQTGGFQARAGGNHFAENFQNGIRLDGDGMERVPGKRRLHVRDPRPQHAQVVHDCRRRHTQQLVAQRGLDDRRCFVQCDAMMEDTGVLHFLLSAKRAAAEHALSCNGRINHNTAAVGECAAVRSLNRRQKLDLFPQAV